MRHQGIVCARVVAATVVAGVLASATIGGVAGQGGGETSIPRMPWGDPDIQGVWSYASLTPLQRPESLGDREYYTPEEAAERNASVLEDVPPRPGSVGTYNALWFDRGEVSPDLRTSLIVDPADGRLPLSDEGQRQVAAQREARDLRPADSWLDRTPWDRCITYHGVPPVSTGYNNTYQIVQTPNYVAILVENIHDVRIIPLDGRPPLPESIRQWNGDSRGRWDGDTLVVETTNYSSQTELRFPSTRDTTAVERFTRVGTDRLRHEFTVEDASIYTRPWTAVRDMPRLPDYVIYEYSCHEGNYAMTGILGGARAQEQDARGTDDQGR